MVTHKLSTSIFLVLPILMGAMFFCISCQSETPITYPPGGYDYPAKDSVTDTNFYYYPLKDLLSRKDSFRRVSSFIYLQAFDEPNLSMKPVGEDVFRFEFEGFKYLPIFVTFDENEMVIKTGTQSNMIEGMIDENRLTQTEKVRYRLMRDHFPYKNNTHGGRYPIERRIDSMIKLYPQLLDAKYYKYLLNKAIVSNAKHEKYTTRRISLSYHEFKRLVFLINNSGYWKMPYTLPDISESSDGYGFALEANTRTKYNFVTASCDCDPKSSFISICREIVKCAGLEKQIDVWFPTPEEKKPVKILLQNLTIADVKEDNSHLPSKKKTKHK